MIETDNFEKVIISSKQELRNWLLKNNGQSESVWIVTYMKHIGDCYVSKEQILDEVLCFGWVDGIRRKLNDNQTMQLISKRKAQHWARSYKKRVENLATANLMHESGIKSVEESKSSGLWNFMDDVDDLILPNDLKQELLKAPPAYSNFMSFNNSSVRNMLRRIKLTKTEKTRIKYIQQTVNLAKLNKKVPQT